MKILTSMVLVTCAFFAGVVFCGEAPKRPWDKMDYGPFLNLTLNLGTKTNGSDGSVLKASVIKLGDAEHPAYIAYDTDTMRVAAFWTGGFIDWNGTIFNGNHHAQPHPKGTVFLSAKNSPGWGFGGKFYDPREASRGPLPKELVHYKGLYRNGQNIVLSYSVADSDVLEMPAIERGATDDAATMVRNFSFSASKQTIDLTLGSIDKAKFNAESLKTIQAPKGSTLDSDGYTIWLEIAPHNAPMAFSFKAKLAKTETIAAPSDLSFSDGSVKFDELIKGGPAQWTEPVETQGVLGKGEGAYVVDTLTIPEKNPWNSWMRIGGFDFFPDGKRAALCTWSGDVWVVSGIDDTLGKLTWKRFATGLYQPLGLKIVNDTIYCTCRDEIVKLHDLNNDGEADFYENFNNDFILSYHFHEFMMDLQTDSEGNFYFAKGGTPGVGGPNFDIVTPHNGCFFKLSKDGKKLDIVARGLRAPNGIGVGPHGELTSGDNEGSWVPVCPINEIKQGGFLGVVPESWPDKPTPDKRDPPICWIPWNVDNSAGCQVWVTNNKWGPFENEMLHLSYGKSSLFHVLTERVKGVMQGGVAKLPVEFASGINRARFNPVDGQLYVSGLKGWQTTASHDGTFQRVRYTGKPANLPAALHVTANGLKITFSTALDKASAEDLENYAAWWFNVVWRKEYGSDRWSPTEPNKKWEKSAVSPPGESLPIKSVKLSEDGKTVIMELTGIKPVTNMVIDIKIKAADGSKINQQICNTIHNLGE